MQIRMRVSEEHQWGERAGGYEYTNGSMGNDGGLTSNHLMLHLANSHSILLCGV